MSPDNPQSSRRGAKEGNSRAGDKSTGGGFDPAVQSQSDSDALYGSAAPAAGDRSSVGLGATEFGTTTGATNYGTTTGSAVSNATGQQSGQASGILDQVRDKAASQLNEQKARATESLGNVAQVVRQSTQRLREQQYDTVAQFVERAADQIERFSNHLRERDLNQLVGEAQHFARQQPAVFIGSSFAAGLLAARFIKASRPVRSFDDRAYGGGSTGSSGFDHGTPYAPGRWYGAGTPQGGGNVYGGGTSTDRSTSFNTSTDRPGDVTGRGDL